MFAQVIVRAMHALSARRADKSVVMQGRDDRNSARVRERRQFEGEIQQAVKMDDVRLHDVEQPRELFADDRRAIGLLEGAADPVVDQLDDRQAVEHAPRDVAMRACGIVFSGQHGDVVPPFELSAQIEGVDLGTCPMTWQKIVDRVEHTEARSRCGFGRHRARVSRLEGALWTFARLVGVRTTIHAEID